jgi:hypothetical protein
MISVGTFTCSLLKIHCDQDVKIVKSAFITSYLEILHINICFKYLLPAFEELFLRQVFRTCLNYTIKTTQ